MSVEVNRENRKLRKSIDFSIIVFMCLSDILFCKSRNVYTRNESTKNDEK